ncbi:HPr family phosphocarrier protein [Desmospora profundinema]|uniref:Phosphotransferase system HPr-like phosphotransfer protein n=1 Tax=Desmospora profundinema TaxID=1571184 RepID=A0ABU1IP27_9BACL|nr:HPr family phosphocarrier protein [Desmospora profundinema]MDR6226541.1 phosphotransferase system HPr-like phosphotransfer protein [Desmospora profundinema]
MYWRKAGVFLSILLFFTGFQAWAAPVSTASDEAFVIRAERIEIQGLLPGLSHGEKGLVLRLSMKEAQIYGMELVGSYGTGAGRWEISITDPGPVAVSGLTVDAKAVGMKLKGDTLLLDSLKPKIVLHDVYLRVVRMESATTKMQKMDLSTLRKVSLVRLKGGIYIDLGGFSPGDREEAERQVNEILMGASEKEEEDPTKKKEQEKKTENEKKPGLTPEEGERDGDRSKESEDEKDKKEGGIPGGSDPTEETVETEVKLGRSFPLFSSWEVVKEARKYESRLLLIQGDKEVNPKWLLEVLKLERREGTPTRIRAEGPDEKEALKAMVQLLTRD